MDLTQASRRERLRIRRVLRKENELFKSKLQKLEFISDYLDFPCFKFNRIEPWRSRDFLVQVFAENGAWRVTVNRTDFTISDGKWLDGITWDELQRIKDEIGFADKEGYEIYPMKKDIMNVNNLRHIWIPESGQVRFTERKAREIPVL